MPFPWLPLGIWAGGQVLSGLFGGSKGKKPEKPEVGKFEPYTVPWDTGAFQKKLELYGQEQRKGIYERAAEKGTYYGAGGTMPGEIGLARQQQMAMAEYQMAMEQQQTLQIYAQYRDYIAHKYGIESAEYAYANDEYLKRLQGGWQGQQALGAGWGEFMGSMGPYMMGGGVGGTTGTTGWGGGSRWTGAGGRRPPGSLQ